MEAAILIDFTGGCSVIWADSDKSVFGDVDTDSFQK
jgi:hypothetical protein